MTECSQIEPGGRQARECRGWGNGLDYSALIFSFLNALMLLLPSICHVICKGNGMSGQQTSVTQET